MALQAQTVPGFWETGYRLEIRQQESGMTPKRSNTKIQAQLCLKERFSVIEIIITKPENLRTNTNYLTWNNDL